ncbi:MAG TPA: kelch repeat-containing protein [Spirochaetota bacterium]|nr:kelch repeat-containing protein [Spirochaetota bacterium]
MKPFFKRKLTRAAFIALIPAIILATSIYSVLLSYAAPDSARWTLVTSGAPFQGRSGHTATVFKNRLWIIGGWNGGDGLNDVWSTTDGKTWTCATRNAPFRARAAHTAVAFDNRLWVIGGLSYDSERNIIDLNDIWYTSDGTHWECATRHAGFTSRGGHSSVIFKNRIWVIGGIAGGADVWNSRDGVTWNRVTNSAEFGSRGGQSTAVLNNEIVLIGGMYVDNENRFISLKDVWISADGNRWRKVHNSDGFFAGGGQSTAVINGRLLVMGGFRKSGTIFASRNGTEWERIDGSAEFGERVAHTCIAFRDRVWVIGGYTGAQHTSDVWSAHPDAL